MENKNKGKKEKQNNKINILLGIEDWISLGENLQPLARPVTTLS